MSSSPSSEPPGIKGDTPKEKDFRMPGFRGVKTTSLFRAVNPELFIKPNKPVMAFGLFSITVCVAYIAYLHATEENKREVAMERIIESLVKKIGLSSNQLLKCVLLHTSIELFSYIDASAYSGSGYLYHDWGMEDFDHLYSALADEGKVLESDVQLQSLPSDRIADFNQPQSVVADASYITSVDELETMYLPIPENLCVQDGQENKLDSNDLDKLESFYYLVGPMNLWLEFPLAQDAQVTQDPSSAAPNSAEDDLLRCFEEELSFLNTRPELSSASEKQEVVLNSYGVQTTEELLAHTFSESFDHGAEVRESILWDSYDLHLSRSPMEATHDISLDWHLKDQIFSDPEDLCTILEEEMWLWSEQADYLWYNDLHLVTGQRSPQQQVASTPFTLRTRKFQGEEDAVKRHEF